MSDVSTPHKSFNAFAPKWKRCRDASDGQDAIHAAGTVYLPKLGAEDDADYTARKLRAGFYNATWRTLGGLLGMMFRKAPTKSLPAGLDAYEPDIDMAGTSLETMARRIALEVLTIGRVGIMVDHPSVHGATPITVKAAEELGLRPLITTYRAESIVNWRYRRVHNRWVLALVVLKEMVSEPVDEFADEEIEQYRVLDLDEANQYRQRVFRRAKGKTGDWIVTQEFWPLMRGQKLAYVPFAILGTDGIDSELDEPPLIDLVDRNLAHYRTTADYEHGCHFTGLPTAWVAGAGPEDTLDTIGSARAWVFSHPDTKVGYLEFTGQGLSALEKNLDRKEQQMAVLGARMLFAEKRAVEAAETAAIHRTGENSVLAALATAVSEGLEWALGVFRDWAGASGEVVYQLNRDYNPAALDAALITAYLKAVQAGEMSSQTFYEQLQRADVADAERTYEEERELIDAKPPPRPVVDAGQEMAA
jgi:hypothetical protein